MDQDTGYCTNCKNEIPSNFSMHQIHCKRNIVLCDYCNDPIRRSEMDYHLREDHKDSSCDLCNEQMEKYLIEQHKEEACPEREVHCQYCDLEVKAFEFSEHKAACGSRTDECENCRIRIMLCHMDDHLKYDCAKKRRPKVNRFQEGTRRNEGLVVPVPKQHLAMDGSTGHNSIPEPTGLIPKPASLIPEPIGLIPKPASLIPQPASLIPKPAGLIPQPAGLIPKPAGLTPMPSHPTMVIDREWVGSVGNSVSNDHELDSLVASNIYHEDIRRSTSPSVDSDAAIALRLQQEYDSQRHMTFTDAQLARNLQDTHLDNVDRVLNNPSHAHQLYNELEEVGDDDIILAQQLQQEEKFARNEGNGGLSTIMIYDRALIHEQQQEERVKQVELDTEIATNLLQEEEYTHPPVGRDTPTLDDDEGMIPCDLCGRSIDFKYYQDHLNQSHPQFTAYVGRFQSHDSLYRPPPRRIESPPPPRSPPSHTHLSRDPIRGEGVSISLNNSICKFCGDQVSSTVLLFHEISCSSNPEKDLMNVYHPSKRGPPEDEETIPCEVCGKDIPIHEFHDHETECQLLDTNNSFRFKPDHDPVPVDDTIPCRTCKGLFPIDTIHSHEAACGIKYHRRPLMNGSTEATPTNQDETTSLSHGQPQLYHSHHEKRKPMMIPQATSSLKMENEQPRRRQHTRLITTLPQSHNSASDEVKSLSWQLQRQRLNDKDNGDMMVKGRSLDRRGSLNSPYGVHINDECTKNTRRTPNDRRYY